MAQKPRLSLNLSKNAPTGAMISTFIGALWIFNYLTSIVTSYAGIPGSVLLDFVTGESIGSSAINVEVLFVVVTRFILSFGLLWGPTTLVVSIVDFVGQLIGRGAKHGERAVSQTSPDPN